MTTRLRATSRRRLFVPLALAGSLLFGCGGNDNGTSGLEQPASVQITENAAVLSVRSALADTAASGGAAREVNRADAQISLMQVIQYNLVATTGGMPILQGTLALKGESEDDGTSELEGRLVSAPAMTAAEPSLQASEAFKARKAELKVVLRAEVERVKAEFDAARAGGMEAAAAKAAYKAAVREAMSAYRTALAEAAAAAGLPRHGEGDGAKHGALGDTKVKGTLDGQGAVVLTLKRKGQDAINLTGTTTLPLGGPMTGTFATVREGTAITGTWTATPAGDTDSPMPPVPPAPPAPPATTPTPCVAQSVTWMSANSSCTANYPGGVSGSSLTLNTAMGSATTGSVTARCTNGVLTTSGLTCSTPAPVAVGDAAAGMTKYANSCSGCHGQGKASDTKINTAAKLTAVLNGVGSHAGLRNSLSDQDRLDIAAYVASPK